MVTKALALLAVAVSALWLVGPLHPAPVEATSHRAVRSFSASSVLPGGRVEVTITPTGYGSFGQVVETLPSGFSYARSSLAAISGCRRRPDRHLHPAGREQLSVYRDGPKRGGFLRVLRGHQGFKQSGGIGLRRFHDTGRPAPYADTDPHAHSYADTHPNAYTDPHADPYTHADAHSYANPNPHSNAATNPDPHCNAATNPDPNADPYTHTLAHADTLGSGTGRGGKHARTGDHPGGCRGSPSYDWRRGVCP